VGGGRLRQLRDERGEGDEREKRVPFSFTPFTPFIPRATTSAMVYPGIMHKHRCLFVHARQADTMSKTVTAQEATSHFSSLLDAVTEGNNGSEEVIIERNGEPRAVLISYDAYRQVQEVREQQRAKILEEFRALQERIAARNQDLTEEESIAIGIEVSKEIIRDIMARDRAKAEREDSSEYMRALLDTSVSTRVF
jgi:prevent-host-death family protein